MHSLPQCNNSSYTQASRWEDALLQFFDRPAVQRTNKVVVVLLLLGIVLVSCLTMGWHNLCHVQEECQSRDFAYITAIHVVNSIADYLILVSLPWRIVQTRHALANGRTGYDWHGNRSGCLFFHIPSTRRRYILLLLLLNALFHYSNHILRIFCYRTYNQSIRMPGLLFTNILVGLSVGCLLTAHSWIALECWNLVKDKGLARREFFENFCRMKKHYPLEKDDCFDFVDDEDKQSETTNETRPASLASNSDEEDEDEEYRLHPPVPFGDFQSDRMEV